MKAAVLADIHGNIESCKAVLRDVDHLGLKRIYIAGDLVGYYYHPAEVLELLRNYDCVVVKGNHDSSLEGFDRLESAEREQIRAKYGSGLSVADKTLSDSQKKWLFALRLVIDEDDILLCHGAPWDADEYVYPDSREKVVEKLRSYGKKVVIMGHTHYPFVWREQQTMIINPGSVGQPRDRRPGASWMVLDLEKHEVEMKNTDYDVDKVAAEASAIDPDVPYLREVLVRQ